MAFATEYIDLDLPDLDIHTLASPMEMLSASRFLGEASPDNPTELGATTQYFLPLPLIEEHRATAQASVMARDETASKLCSGQSSRARGLGAPSSAIRDEAYIDINLENIMGLARASMESLSMDCSISDGEAMGAAGSVTRLLNSSSSQIDVVVI